jgi:predicted nucleotidyltransferase
MHIYIFGNLNSGKTTLSQYICQHLPSFSYLSLDEYRIQYSDGSELGEQQACNHFITAVNQTSDAVIEFSGYGPVAEAAKQQCTQKQGILIHCARDIKASIVGINDEKYAKIPYPESYKKAQRIEDTIHFLSDQTTLKNLENRWQAFIWQSDTFEFGQDFSAFWRAFPLSQHLWVDRFRQALCDDLDSSALLVFGSLGANQLTTLSDIDFFIQSTCSVAYWHSKLITLFSAELAHSDILGTKITLRMHDRQLIEVVVGQSLAEIALYYCESQIYNVNFTVLKGSEAQVKELTEITQQKSNDKEKATELAAQVYFLFCSLPNLIAKNDSYKYSFHCSIIQHYCVQLAHLLMGKTQHNYLPKYAATTLEYFPWSAFSTSPMDIQTNQYIELHHYLIELFKNLMQSKLIDNKNYFSDETRFLHQIITTGSQEC